MNSLPYPHVGKTAIAVSFYTNPFKITGENTKTVDHFVLKLPEYTSFLQKIHNFVYSDPKVLHLPYCINIQMSNPKELISDSYGCTMDLFLGRDG